MTLERAPSPRELVNAISEVDASDGDAREAGVAPDISEAIATHLAEQLYQFKGCATHQHHEEMQAIQLNHVPTKHGDIRHLTRHLEGLADRDATPLPDVLSSPRIMSRGSIPNCNFEQIFEGRADRPTQRASPSPPRSVIIEILPSGTSSRESDSDSAESLPSPGNVANVIPHSRPRRTRDSSTSATISAIATGSASASTSVSGQEPDALKIDAVTPCLEAYHGQSRSDAPKEPSPDVSFDVDSTCCFPSSLAIATQGILAYATVNKAANLAASVHFAICDSTIDADAAEVVVDSVPLHLVPHYAFGQMVGLPDVLIYIFFPMLRHDVEYKTSSYLSNEDQDICFDTILLPCRNKAITSSNKRQHHPPSLRVADLESTAASAEGYTQKISSRQQVLRYPLQPENLDLLWRLICTQIEEAVVEGMPEARFANPLLFITGKNSKLHYMESGPVAETLDLLPRAFDRWHRAWTAATDPQHYTPETLFIDLAKQTTSSDSELPPAPAPAAKLWPEVYTWKKCCLDTYLRKHVQAVRGPGRHSGGNYPNVAHYPFATLKDTGGLTIASQYGSLAERSGLVYTQFYNLVKNAFDAAKVYPFENEALENLALDPDYVESLKHVGKGANTFSTKVCRTSYLHSKQRTHAALLDNQWRSFGTREEHRLSLALVLRVVGRWRQWQEQSEAHERHLAQLREDVGMPHFFFYSPDIFAFLRAQINRFCFLFEQVYSWLGPSHSLEEFVMMTLALRTLRFSYGSSVLAAESTLYKDKWDTQAGAAREGLGLGVAMTQCRFGWLLPKIEWATFRVRAEHSSQLVVGMPLLHSSYHRRWRQVRDLGDVHLRLH